MDKEDLKKYYCKHCNAYYQEPKHFIEDRTPLGEASNSSFYEHLEGCPNCEGGLKVMYYCPRCDKFNDNIDYYPFADEYMCYDCYEEMMRDGELVENQMEEVINNDVGRGLPNEEREEIKLA